MLADELGVLGDVAGVEVGDAQVQQDVEDIGQIEDGEVEAVDLVADGVLHAHLDAEYPEGFYQQVGQQHPKESGE